LVGIEDLRIDNVEDQIKRSSHGSAWQRDQAAGDRQYQSEAAVRAHRSGIAVVHGAPSKKLTQANLETSSRRRPGVASDQMSLVPRKKPTAVRRLRPARLVTARGRGMGQPAHPLHCAQLIAAWQPECAPMTLRRGVGQSWGGKSLQVVAFWTVGLLEGGFCVLLPCSLAPLLPAPAPAPLLPASCFLLLPARN
jgi:hypothetical protein